MKVYSQKNGLTIFGFDKKTYLFNYVYLYGDLELENGYDIVETETKEEQNISEGIYDIEVVLHDGRIVPGRLYYWKVFGGTYRGFIVSPTDEEGINYVLEYYDNRMSTWEENEEEDDMAKPVDEGITREKLQILMENAIPEKAIEVINKYIYDSAKKGQAHCTLYVAKGHEHEEIIIYSDAIKIYYEKREILVYIQKSDDYIIEGKVVDAYEITFDWSLTDLSNPLIRLHSIDN